MKYPDDFIGKIIQGDCLEVMRHMPDKCVDLVLTDPPYGMNKFKGDEKNFIEVLTPAFQEIGRVLKQDGFAFIFTSTAEVVNLANALPFKLRRLLWLYKPADCTFPFDGWLLKSEAILYMTHDGKKANIKDPIKYEHDVMQQKLIGKEGVEGHPTVKSLEIISRLAVRCPDDGIIFDPFLGSGTTAVAAERLGRRWIGIEMEPKYCAIAQARVDAERNQLKLPGML